MSGGLTGGLAGGLRRGAVRVALGTAAVVASLSFAASTASAHPLGNFTVNHYDGLTLRPDRVDDLAVVDSAEIPTLQDHIGDDLSARAAAARCADVAAASDLRVDGRAERWTVVSSALTLNPGAAGLSTSRLTCGFTAPRRRSADSAVAFRDDYRSDRIGWHEITATGQGVRLTQSSVPERTISDELRHYPNDLLTSPLDVRSATVGTGGVRSAAPAAAGFGVAAAGPVTRALGSLNTTVDDLVGAKRLSIGVALLALLLALILGASHAALPGHGKTVMAAYLAGRGGGVRDAVTVGVTVTATHTTGVIVLGLLLSTSAHFAGESVLGWLGTASGLLMTLIGAMLLRSAWRDRALVAAAGGQGHGHGHSHGLGGGHSHGGLFGGRHEHHADHDGHSHSHDGHHDHDGPHDHPGHSDHHDEHDHNAHHHHHDHAADGDPVRASSAAPALVRFRRRALIGMGVAGGLVPSPSALVVLLGAIALGRTAFGIALVIGYGLGMAATLTAAGLVLVRLRDRMGASRRGPAALTARLSRITPLATASLVLVVGAGLALQSLPMIR